MNLLVEIACQIICCFRGTPFSFFLCFFSWERDGGGHTHGRLSTFHFDEASSVGNWLPFNWGHWVL